MVMGKSCSGDGRRGRWVEGRFWVCLQGWGAAGRDGLQFGVFFFFFFFLSVNYYNILNE